MNVFLKKFIAATFTQPGKALDMGAGKFSDVAHLEKFGWKCEGIDQTTGIDLELPYFSKHAPFDLVFSNYVLHKLKNKQQLIKTAFENLKNGGWFFVHTFDKSDKQSRSTLTGRTLRSMLHKEHFKNISIKAFDFYDEEPNHHHWHRVLEATAQK